MKTAVAHPPKDPPVVQRMGCVLRLHAALDDLRRALFPEAGTEEEGHGTEPTDAPRVH